MQRVFAFSRRHLGEAGPFDANRLGRYDVAMHHPAFSLEQKSDQRKSPRVQLKMPARVRWHGPLGMRLELTQTIDVAREGLLLRRKEKCSLGTRVWVTYPYDKTAPAMSMTETPARVVRVDETPVDGFQVALHLHLPRKAGRPQFGIERRVSSRVYSAVPIFVRIADSPWPEESMTQDFSRSGVRFETNQIYAQGDLVYAKIPWAEWSRAGEIEGRVARVESTPDVSVPAPLADPDAGRTAIYTSVAVRWTKPATQLPGA